MTRYHAHLREPDPQPIDRWQRQIAVGLVLLAVVLFVLVATFPQGTPMPTVPAVVAG